MLSLFHFPILYIFCFLPSSPLSPHLHISSSLPSPLSCLLAPKAIIRATQTSHLEISADWSLVLLDSSISLLSLLVGFFFLSPFSFSSSAPLNPCGLFLLAFFPVWGFLSFLPDLGYSVLWKLPLWVFRLVFGLFCGPRNPFSSIDLRCSSGREVFGAVVIVLSCGWCCVYWIGFVVCGFCLIRTSREMLVGFGLLIRKKRLLHLYDWKKMLWLSILLSLLVLRSVLVVVSC